jgi:hypothetical protein
MIVTTLLLRAARAHGTHKDICDCVISDICEAFVRRSAVDRRLLAWLLEPRRPHAANARGNGRAQAQEARADQQHAACTLPELRAMLRAAVEGREWREGSDSRAVTQSLRHETPKRELTRAGSSTASHRAAHGPPHPFQQRCNCLILLEDPQKRCLLVLSLVTLCTGRPLRTRDV